MTPNNTIAQRIINCIFGAQAVTLEGGYAVFAGGKRVYFQPATIEKEKKNKEGRCTMLLAKFKDGSKIDFRWSKDRGPSYRSMSA